MRSHSTSRERRCTQTVSRILSWMAITTTWRRSLLQSIQKASFTAGRPLTLRPQTATSYGTDVNLQAGLRDALLIAYLLVSQAWHRDVAFRDSPSDTASSHKRSSSPEGRTQHPWSNELGWILACRYDESCGRGRPSNNVSVSCSIRMQALAVSSNVRASF